MVREPSLLQREPSGISPSTQDVFQEPDPVSLIIASLDLGKEAHLVLSPDTETEAGLILYADRPFQELTGYTLEEVRNRPASLLYTRETAEILRAQIHEILTHDALFSRDVLLRRKNGEETWAELTVVAVECQRGEPGALVRWVATLRDISEQKLTEQSLLESQVRLNSILNSLSDVVWSMSIGLDRFIYLSPSTERVFGRPIDDFYRDVSLWFSMIHPEDRGRVSEEMRAGISHGSFEIDYRIARDNGEIRWLRNRGRVIFDRAGKPVHLDGIADDITQSKIAELRLERMANFPSYNPNPVYELSETGEVQYSNEAALRLAESLGFNNSAAILPPDLVDVVAHCLGTAQPQLRREEAYGDRTISWSFFPIPEGRLVHCYAGEISERLKLENQLRTSEKLNSIGQLAGGVAHDFNNILTVIQGFTNLLLSQEHGDPTVVDQLSQIAVAAERARDLTRQLLTFSRRQVLKPTTLDINKIIHDLTKMLARLLGEQIDLRILCGQEEILIEGDRSMMEQIVLNLVANARDAVLRGGGVWIATEVVDIRPGDPLEHPEARAGRFVRFSTKDNGCGMDERTLARIFEPFFTTKELGKGTGLGLATVYGAVKQHGGWLQVESEVGVGTTFHIFLPISANERRSHVPEKHEGKIPGGTETIFVVEDEGAVRQLVATILKASGYKIIEAKNGLDALRVWSQHQDEVDLLLTDLVMPGTISGIDLAEKLTGEKPSLKVILSSGYSAEITGQNPDVELASNFLAKPYPPQALLKMVRAVLDQDAVAEV